MTRFLLPALLAGLVFSGGVKADIIYVDADASNTTLADGSPLSGGVTTAGAADGLWRERAFGNSASIFESNASGGEDAPRLRTTISGLTVGETYEVFAYFWGGGNALWRGRVSLTDEAGDLPGYNTSHFSGSSFSPMSGLTSFVAGDSGLNPGPLWTATGGVVDSGYFTGTVISEEADRRLYQVSLGEVIATSSSIDVFIDDLANTAQANRTWYDGVGFQVSAVPEPSSLTVIALGAIGLIVRRRR